MAGCYDKNENTEGLIAATDTFSRLINVLSTE